MFTGIIEELGIVRTLDRKGAIPRLQIRAPQISQDVRVGQSVCVNGACLTLVNIKGDLLDFEIMQETLRRTNLAFLHKFDKVNLERSLTGNKRLDGHFVTGHIDCMGIIKQRQTRSNDLVLEIEFPEEVQRYIALKGSVALDGVSLTISAQGVNALRVNLIPYTLKYTTLGFKKERDLVNIECDILAKYCARFSSPKGQFDTSKLSLSFLQEHGFI